ncbi:SusC/RagA family TonB-linked outer membrane protein [Pseudalgibacter alginicilyticus]|uniref:SusC/RagA family TonB-linked outer membrane protein n=1 Tax=Pseudalgibacter alginicilyticus TaxID=1736674 RepID=A0A0P0CLY4_9FLAO|nr:TonB-dependent receptor [Pseudalgibacter alginicilyticus]ALJ03735.1 SusC/RagA family TonB-linked outer membrane protein [Pseudalgibacter alginicilyticus]
MKKIKLLLLTLFVSVTSISWAQKEITGTVLDDQNIPLSGANILVKGTTNGVSADFDGNFNINAEIGDVLEVSFLGMKTKEVVISNYQTIMIVLDVDAAQLDDIVIVGYGSQKRSDVTGAISSVKSESFNKGVVANAGQLLQGKVAGVNVTSTSGEPGSSQNIIIRGVGSLRSGTTPLYVVDGFALDNTGNGVASNPLNFINPEDIQSIDVLKDASAAAIYGSRAANGVIVITTKKGKSGKTQMNLSVSTAFSTLTNKVDVFNAEEFRSGVNAVGGTLADGGASTDWQDELSRTGVSKKVNFSMSGGAEKSTYSASIGVDDQEGILRNSNLKRYSGRLNLTQKAFDDKFKVEFNLTASKLENVRPNTSSVVDKMLTMNPTDAPYVNGEINTNLSNDIFNPLIAEELYGDFTHNYRLLGNVAPSYEIVDGLVYKLNIGVDYSSTDRDVQDKPYASATNITLGSLNTSSTSNSNTLLENTLTYTLNKNLNSFTFLVGHTYQQTEVSQKSFSLSGFPANGVEPRYQIETATEPTSQSAYATKNELQSFFGRLNYAYNDKYLVTATMRADGSSKFGENNKYGYFPSVALGWNLINEDFLIDSETFSNLKLRASWGQTGSQEIPSKITQASYTESITGNDTYPLDESATDLSGYPYGSIYVRLANPDIQWEVSTQTNIGLDFGLLNNKLTGTIDYFNKVSENILLEVAPVDPIQPTDKYWTNIPKMEIKNSGVEIALDFNNDRGQDFSYNIGGNISLTKNEVIDSPYKILTTGSAQGSGQTGATINGILNGESIGAFYVQEFIGIGSDGLNQFADTNNDGEILDDDRIVAGSALPDYIYAFYMNFKYKNFDLGLNFNGAGGNKIYNHVAMSSFNKGNLANSFNTTDRAIEFLNEANTNSNLVSTRYLEDGDFLRLNNVTLGYNLSPEVLGIQDVMNNIRLTITGQNLFVITDYSGYDPEINTGSSIGGIQTFGIDYFSYPKSRTILFGLNLTF